MSIWKRSTLYLLRNKWKSILLILILTVISSMLLITLTICKNCGKEINELRETYGESFIIKVDDGKRMSLDLDDARQLQVYDDLIDKVMEIEGITNVSRGTYFDVVYFEDIEFIPGRWSAIAYGDPEEMEWYTNNGINPLVNAKEMSVYGYDKSELSSYFRTNSYELIEGRHLMEKDRYKILISDVLAERNQLRVGDPIHMKLTEAQYENGGDINHVIFEKDLEIAGIFHVNVSQIISEFTQERDIAENYVFTTNDVLQECNQEFCEERGWESRPHYSEAEFFVKDIEEIEKIIEEVKTIEGVEWDLFEIYPNDAAYQSALSPLQNISRQFIVMMVFAGGICVILLALILRMWTRIRKKEIGIFLAIGDGKGRIIGQLVLEGVLMVCVSLLISCAVALSVSSSIGNAMLTKQNEQKEKQEAKLEETINHVENFEGSHEEFTALLEEASLKTEVKRPDKITGRVTWDVVFTGGSVVLMVMIVTILMTARGILRMKPKEILSML